MAYGNRKDQETALLDIGAPIIIESRQITSASVTFSASFSKHTLYTFVNESPSQIVYFRLDGTTPVVTSDGLSGSMGIPVMPLTQFFVYFSASSGQTLKAISKTGETPRLTVFCGPRIEL